MTIDTKLKLLAHTLYAITGVQIVALAAVVIRGYPWPVIAIGCAAVGYCLWQSFGIFREEKARQK